LLLLTIACNHQYDNSNSPNTPENIPESFKENAEAFVANIEKDGQLITEIM